MWQLLESRPFGPPDDLYSWTDRDALVRVHPRRTVVRHFCRLLRPCIHEADGWCVDFHGSFRLTEEVPGRNGVPNRAHDLPAIWSVSSMPVKLVVCW